MKTLFVLCVALFFTGSLRAQNFVSTEPGQAKRYVARAETERQRLARFWTGQTLPKWSKPCVLTVRRANQNSGRTTFAFDRGEVFGWQMEVNGPTLNQVCDSVIPHEVNHTIFASICRRPLPRWFDEGAATFCETAADHAHNRRSVASLVQTRRFVPVADLFSAGAEYGNDSDTLTAQYSEGFSIVEYLVATEGRERLVEFAESGADENALRAVYRIDNADDLERRWYAWFRKHQANGFGCSVWGCPAPGCYIGTVPDTRPRRNTPLTGEVAPPPPIETTPTPTSSSVGDIRKRLDRLESLEIPVQLIDGATGTVVDEKRYPIGEPIKLIFNQLTIEGSTNGERN